MVVVVRQLEGEVPVLRQLEGVIYKCKYCQAHLTPAYTLMIMPEAPGIDVHIFNEVVNVTFGEPQARWMLTSLNTVMDIFCLGCGVLLGIKYVVMPRENTRRNTVEGKFGLNSAHISLYSPIQDENGEAGGANPAVVEANPDGGEP